MTALTSNVQHRGRKEGNLLSLPVLAAKHIYKGAVVKIGAGGYLDATAAEASAFLAGVAYEEVDNTGLASGAKSCLVITRGVIEVVSTGLTIADMFSPVYSSDDQTVSTTQATNEIKLGIIVKVISATRAMVAFDAI